MFPDVLGAQKALRCFTKEGGNISNEAETSFPGLNKDAHAPSEKERETGPISPKDKRSERSSRLVACVLHLFPAV